MSKRYKIGKNYKKGFTRKTIRNYVFITFLSYKNYFI